MVEVGRGELGIVGRQETPRAVVEALAGDVDVVGVQHAMHEAGRHPLPTEPGDPADDVGKERGGALGRVVAPGLRQIGADGVVEQAGDVVRLLESGEALERADADVRVVEPDQHGGARRRGFVAVPQVLAGFDQAERLAAIDAERLQHLGRQHLAHAALQREAAVAGAGPGGLAAYTNRPDR